MLARDLVMDPHYLYVRNNPVLRVDPSGWVDTVPSHGRAGCSQIGPAQVDPWRSAKIAFQPHQVLVWGYLWTPSNDICLQLGG